MKEPSDADRQGHEGQEKLNGVKSDEERQLVLFAASYKQLPQEHITTYIQP